MGIFSDQQQARQLRRIEEAMAANAGRPLRKLSFRERWLLGVRNHKVPMSERPMPSIREMQNALALADLLQSLDRPAVERDHDHYVDIAYEVLAWFEGR